MAQEAIQYEDIIRQDPGFAAAVTEEDGSFDDVPSYDDERFETDESEEAAAFCGCWEYQDTDLWLCVYKAPTNGMTRKAFTAAAPITLRAAYCIWSRRM